MWRCLCALWVFVGAVCVVGLVSVMLNRWYECVNMYLQELQ